MSPYDKKEERKVKKLLESRSFTIESTRNKLVTLEVIPGHFATGSSHLNYYLNMEIMKSNALVARDAAREIAIPYLSNTDKIGRASFRERV